MIATRSGCIVGFSDDVQRSIPQPCAHCNGPHTKWWPWPGLWLCQTCFMVTNSTDLAALKEKENDKS